MEGIYKEDGFWWVNELADIFYFKSINQETGEESLEILSWTRMVDLSIYPKNPVRMYDIESNSKKCYFLLYQVVDRYKIEVENIYELDELCREKNIILKEKNKL